MHIVINFTFLDNAKPFAEEMNRSLTSHLARLESENESLSQRLETSEQKLLKTNHNKEQLQEHSDALYKKRLLEMEKQVREIRQRMARDLSQDFAMKVGSLTLSIHCYSVVLSMNGIHHENNK